MYIPAHFAEPRTEVLHELIRQQPLGVLVTHGAGGLDANHIPFELDAGAAPLGLLHGHVARANPVWRELRDGAEVLVVFQAEHGYLSPTWYPSKHEQHRQVPSWNYRVVHAHGRITIHDDERHVRSVVARLTRRHEAGQPVPWKMGDSPAEFIDTLLKAIVGIEIEITRLAGKFKLSQNKAASDIQGAAEAYRAQGRQELGDAMLAAAALKRQQDQG